MSRGKKHNRRNSRIWVVLHCEVVLTLHGPVVDEAVFFTADSRKSAERLMRKSWVDSGTWWRLECVRLNDIQGTRGPSILYSRSGRVIRMRPFEKGYNAAIRRNKRLIEDIDKRIKTSRESGLSRRVIANLKSTVRSIRSVLSRSRSR